MEIYDIEPEPDFSEADIDAEQTNAAPLIERRAVALDILRGLAILMMVFSGCVPFDKRLPNWLFHAQEPTTYDINHNIVHIFDPTHAGITFVDLVFPFFLFSLGAALPLALTKRMDRGASKRTVILGGLVRLIQLAWFAVYIGNLRPAILHDTPTTVTWLIALLAFLLMFAMYTRLPDYWRNWQKLAVRALGYGGGLALLVMLNQQRYYPGHIGFQLARVDVIIVSLGDMALFATAIWALSRGSILPRLGVMAFLLAIRLGALQPGWVHNIWTFAPKNTGFIFAFDYLKYLFIVIPGTIAGDMIRAWITEQSEEAVKSSTSRLLGYVILTALLTVGVLVGLEGRFLWQTAVLCFASCAAAWWLLSRPADFTERLVTRLMAWGVFWLLLGIILESFEGGIKKDPSTLSYYFVTAGLAYFILSSFTILTSIYKLERPFELLIYNGQNPMIAYVAMGNFILPILALTHIQPLLNTLFDAPWMGVLLGAIETIVLALFVRFLTQKEIYWRT